MEIIDILNAIPKKDKAYILYNGRWHRIAEHEIRGIQVAVAKKQIVTPRIKFSNGEEVVWDKSRLGRFDTSIKTNIFSINSFMTRQLLILENNLIQQKSRVL